MLRLEKLRRFGSSSEQTNPDQPELFESTAEAAETEAAATEHIEYDRRKGKNKNLNGHAKRCVWIKRAKCFRDFAKLASAVWPFNPRLSLGCPVTGQPMIRIGEDVTEQLAVEPPIFYVNKYVQFQIRESRAAQGQQGRR